MAEGPDWRKWTPALAIVAALLVAGGVAALLFMGGSTHNQATSATAPSPTIASEGSPAPSTDTQTNPSTPSQSARPAIIGVLQEYAMSYSEASVGGLAKLFTSGVERHGLSEGGCSTVSGKSAVLSAYRSQFAQNGPLSYELVGLTLRDVVLYGDGTARVDTQYSIASVNNSGAISFTLEDQGGPWLISAVNATCHPSH